MRTRTSLKWFGWPAAVVVLLCAICVAKADSPAATSIYSFTVQSIDGKSVPLADYKGKVLLIVNTASLCGNTPQYASLQKLYETYQSKGLRILAFPEDDFANQEPGDNSQIKQFCTSRFHVSFALFSKIDVNGPNQAPLYKYLTDPSTDPQFGQPIEWNFAKFLIDRDGNIVNRFKAGYDPLHPDVVSAIESALAKPA